MCGHDEDFNTAFFGFCKNVVFALAIGAIALYLTSCKTCVHYDDKDGISMSVGV